MRINYFSDVHLEFGELTPPQTDADLVIAAGDIGVFNQGVHWLKKLNKPVIYVAGNHEFYFNEYHQVLSMLRSSCAHSNIHFLEKDPLILDGVRFLGCTLWTDLMAEGQEKANILSNTINDFHRILYGDKIFDLANHIELHQQSIEWLTKQLATPFDGKTIIVTHHAPTEWSWNRSPNSTRQLAYCNDLKYLLHQHDITAWFHGHIHHVSDYRIGETRVLSNTRGYCTMQTIDDFDINRVVDI